MSKYGRLYTWYAVNDSRNIAPIGWHVPTDAEWLILEKYLATNLGSSGSIAKSMASTECWATSEYIRVSISKRAVGYDPRKNNNSGFAGLPCGFRSAAGSFHVFQQGCAWWCSTAYNGTYAWSYSLNIGSEYVDRDYERSHMGFSVRCIRDY